LKFFANWRLCVEFDTSSGCATFSPVEAEKEFELSRPDFFVSLWRNAAE
jgi:hypothetical protein